MNTLQEILEIFVGEYRAVTYSADGLEIIPDGFAGLDIPWIFGALIFFIGIYSIFRIIGIIISKF